MNISLIVELPPNPNVTGRYYYKPLNLDPKLQYKYLINLHDVDKDKENLVSDSEKLKFFDGSTYKKQNLPCLI